MIVCDEIKNRYKFITLSWVEFLEFLGRCTDCIAIPTDEDLELVKVGNVLDFQKGIIDLSDPALEKEITNRHEGSSEWDKRLLHPKMERLVRLILGRLGVLHKGYLKSGTKSLKLFPKYVSGDQLETLEF